jgi:fermentation-respiration switch protein FrsA (DUF1100 family)
VGSHGLNPLPVASRIRVPLLLVVSEQDPLVSPAQMRLLARRVRGPVRVLVRPGGTTRLEPARSDRRPNARRLLSPAVKAHIPGWRPIPGSRGAEGPPAPWTRK